MTLPAGFRLLKKDGKFVKNRDGSKFVLKKMNKPCLCCDDAPPPDPDPDPVCPPYAQISVVEAVPNIIFPAQPGDYCNRFTSRVVKLAVPDQFKLPCRVSVAGGVDDDLSIDGKVIEQGRYPLGLSPMGFEVQCNIGHLVGQAEPNTQWVFEVNKREFEVYAIDNIGGNMGFNLTFCFGVKDPLSQWPKRSNPFP